MRIATYNVHSCVGTDGRCDPKRIAAVLAEMDLDIACLQEVDVDRIKTGRTDQVAEIAGILGMQFYFNPTIEDTRGQYGDAILSRPDFKVVAAGHFPPVPRPVPRECRGVIWIEVRHGCETWQVFNTHLGLGYSERRLQARALMNDWIVPGLARSPVILCGDFNSRPASTVHKIIGESLRDACILRGHKQPRTFPTRWPAICLDYVFVSDDVTVKQIDRWATPSASIASDHFPLLAEVELTRPTRAFQ